MLRSKVSTPCKVSTSVCEEYLSPPRSRRKTASIESACRRLNPFDTPPPKGDPVFKFSTDKKSGSKSKKAIMNTPPRPKEFSKSCYSTIKKKTSSLSPVRIINTLDNRKMKKKIKPIAATSFDEMLAKCCSDYSNNEDYDKRRVNSYETMQNINKLNPKYDLESYMLSRVVTQKSKSKPQVMKSNVKLSLNSSYIEDNNRYMIRTSELEPSLFQLNIPSIHDMLCNIRLCYYVFNRKYNIDIDDDLDVVDNSLIDQQQQVENKIVLEDIIRANDTYEVYLFNNTNENRIIICYHAISKPKQNTTTRKTKDAIKEMSSDEVNTPFYNAYNTLPEKLITTRIKSLKSNNPFADVVFVGYSTWNASIATIASIRYATYHSNTRVYCNAFGAPRIGTQIFKDYAHSLPNLNIFRVELHGNNTSHYDYGYQYAGHLMTLSSASSRAYKFHKHYQQPTNNSSGNNSFFKSPFKSPFKTPSKKRKTLAKQTNLKNYVDLLDSLCKNKFSVENFVGEDGKGVSGLYNESRVIV